ncbi:hypothetical protein [Actinomadura roseirufa]|uniref:hypothetical protein n=1 Tax=Actinomadura roseirufa TaxID=2094049 RepID=UPI0010414A7A|nr:hypothetical protein [Actinomadura roseirufa]
MRGRATRPRGAADAETARAVPPRPLLSRPLLSRSVPIRTVRAVACTVAGGTAACAGAVAVIALGGTDALIVADAAVTVTIAVGGMIAVRLVRDVREEQRRIRRHLEAQTCVMENAARVAADRYDDPR